MEEQVSPVATDESAPGFIDFLSGLFLGFLIGLLVGISVSPLTGDVLAGLMALLAAFFGLGGKLPGAAPLTRSRLLAFSIGVLIALPTSIYVRTNGLLEPSLDLRIDGYTAAGVPEELARNLAIFDRSGLRLGELAQTPKPEAPRNPGYTFSAGTSAECSGLSDSVFSSTQLRLQAMQSSDAPWDQAGTFGLSLPEAQQAAFADFIHGLLCDGPE